MAFSAKMRGRLIVLERDHEGKSSEASPAPQIHEPCAAVVERGGCPVTFDFRSRNALRWTPSRFAPKPKTKTEEVSLQMQSRKTIKSCPNRQFMVGCLTQWQLQDVPLVMGVNSITVRARDLDGNEVATLASINHVAADADVETGSAIPPARHAFRSGRGSRGWL